MVILALFRTAFKPVPDSSGWNCEVKADASVVAMQYKAKTVPADLTVNLGKAPDQTAYIL